MDKFTKLGMVGFFIECFTADFPAQLQKLYFGWPAHDATSAFTFW